MAISPREQLDEQLKALRQIALAIEAEFQGLPDFYREKVFESFMHRAAAREAFAVMGQTQDQLFDRLLGLGGRLGRTGPE